ncbi:MAG: S8 family serine peptidase [Bacteroidales bacterium]|nr:S8 family serine peptidase [Bacteroidales bacterium]MCF8458746.1 S8 family serine peptidase [Bacteroidales bacterium]
MKKFSILFLIFVSAIIGSTSVFGQKQGIDYSVYLKNGTIRFLENISSFRDNSFLKEHEKYGDKLYRYIQFYEIPSQEQRGNIEQLGISLLEYIPRNVYVASIPLDFDFSALQSMNVRSLIEIPALDRMNILLLDRPFPDWSLRGNEIRLMVQYYSDINPLDVAEELDGLKIKVLETMGHSHKMIVQIDPSQIELLASQAFIRYLDFEGQPGEPESDDGRNLHRANAIDVDYYGGYSYDGTGVSVAINDDGYAGPHIDFKGRTDQTDVANDFTGDHGDMTVGIVGAAGNLDPTMRGMAPGAFLWVREYYPNLPNTVTLHQNEDVMVFSTSYSAGCNEGYTSITQMVDEEIYDNPSLMQVFSAGNGNGLYCNYGAGNQWGNITGGHKMAKNVMTTANLNHNDVLASSSSRGPASDGRIKPDIAAHGSGHWSTTSTNAYAAGGGTSAAAPGIAGVFAQLNQAYRDFNNGTDAPSALLKASILNTAYDLGNTGPDFKFGWGKVNAYKVMKTLEEGRYIADSITNGIIAIHALNVPANVQELRIMVYWHDVEASTSAQFALVNNLDLTVVDSSGIIHYPLILDHTPNATTLDNPATPGIDSINNVEQVRISNPSQGNYQIKVTGTSVPQGPQDYFIVYEIIYDEIMVTYPIGGEGLIPGSTERIHWDAYGTSGNFTAAYTLDSGITWVTISDTIPGISRFIDFQVPNTVSLAKVRISRNNISDESDAFFSIIGTPYMIHINAVCPVTNTVFVVWDSVPNATSYDIFYLGAKYMDSIGTTSAFTYTIPVSNITQDHWVSARARGPNGEVGRRAHAITAITIGGCQLDCISYDDAGVAALVSPALYNESCLGLTTDVTVKLTNMGPNVQTNFPVYYKFDNNALVSDTFSGALPGGAMQLFTFNTPLSFGSIGFHTLKIWTGLSNDGAHCNDTLVKVICFYDPVMLFSYYEDFQSGSFPPAWMPIDNPDNSLTWEEAYVTGSNGLPTLAAFVDNFYYNSAGQEDVLSVINFDLSNTLFTELKFEVAHSMYSTSKMDGLRVEVSGDCGQSYSQVYFKEGDSLATAPSSVSLWEPSSPNDWRQEAIDLTAYCGGMAKIRFINITGNGNSLYLDNIQLESISQAPYTNFVADVMNTCNGTVYFTDLSEFAPHTWLWDFGDNTTSTDQNPVHTYNNEGVYTISLTTSNPVGSNTLTVVGYITVDYLDNPVWNDSISCNGGPVELIVANGLDEVRWYDAGILVHVGDTFTTPTITSDVVYQSENIMYQTSSYVGPVDNTIGGGGIHSSSVVSTINFVAEKELWIVSAWVEVQTAGDRTFYLWDDVNGMGNAIQEVIVNIPAGTGRIDLGFHVPAPGPYSIGGSNVDMYRNTSWVNYPFILPGLITLTGSSGNPSGVFYFYLYDLEIQQAPCRSQMEDVPVKYVHPEYIYSIADGTIYFLDISVGATTWLWDFGDGQTSTDQHPSVSYATSGTYTVTLEIDGNCTYSEDIAVSTISIEGLENSDNLVLIPNPTNDKTELIVRNAFLGDAILEVISMEGKVLMNKTLPSGKRNIQLDLGNLSPAVYYVRLISDTKTMVKKVVVQK